MYNIIGRPVNDPKAIVVQPITKQNADLSESDKKQIQQIISTNLENMDKFCTEFISKKIDIA
jgi:S-adenosylmethionine synthetase